MLEKRKVLEACVKAQGRKIEDLKQSLEKTAQAAIEAPSSKQSWSDTTKFQQSNLALAIQKTLVAAELALSQLRTLSPVANDVISVGALFNLKNTDSGEITSYFLIPEGGGDSFDVEDEEVTVISLAAPLAKAMIGKKKGDWINFRSRILEIIEVQ